MRKVHVNLGARSYDIVIGAAIIDQINLEECKRRYTYEMEIMFGFEKWSCLARIVIDVKVPKVSRELASKAGR